MWIFTSTTPTDFNPRSLAGATSSSFLSALGKALFQSSLPCGSDHRLSACSYGIDDFNPRSLTGATAGYNLFRSPMLEFQSTLPYGSDDEVVDTAHALSISIHAPLRERPCFEEIFGFLFNFNPRSLTGATYYNKPQIHPSTISIHAPLRERLV